MRKRSLVGLMVGLAMLVGAAQASAVPVIFTDEGMWNTAVFARTALSSTETFDDMIFQPWLTVVSDLPGGASAFQWESIVRTNSAPVLTDTFQHSWARVFAWCGTFDLATPGGPGEGINVFSDLGGVDVLIGNIDRSYQGFWGFVLDNTDYFTYVRLEGGGDPLGVQETYWMDDLSIGADAPVPDAGSSLLLLGMGLAGLRAWKRRLG